MLLLLIHNNNLRLYTAQNINWSYHVTDGLKVAKHN